MKRVDLPFKMKELEFELIDKIKSYPFTMDKKEFLKKTQSYLELANECISFFESEKLDLQGKVLIASMDNRLHYELINHNDNLALSKMAMIGDFYIVYGCFKLEQDSLVVAPESRLLFATTRGSILAKLEPFVVEEDSFSYKIAS